MDEPLSQKSEVPNNEKLSVPCGECDKATRHLVLAVTNTHWQSPDGHVDVWDKHLIVQCQGCLTVSFREESRCSEDWDHDEFGNMVINATVKHFPSRVTGRPVMSNSYHLPHGVYSIYMEAHASLCAEQTIVTGFGIRAIVEAVCKDKSATGRNLKQKINSLQSMGLVTESGKDILHSLRFMGNVAAHEMKSHKPLELNAAFDVVEHMLQGVYVLPKTASKLPQNGS